MIHVNFETSISQGEFLHISLFKSQRKEISKNEIIKKIYSGEKNVF